MPKFVFVFVGTFGDGVTTDFSFDLASDPVSVGIPSEFGLSPVFPITDWFGGRRKPPLPTGVFPGPYAPVGPSYTASLVENILTISYSTPPSANDPLVAFVYLLF